MCPKIRCDEKSEKILQNFLGTTQGLKGKKKKQNSRAAPSHPFINHRRHHHLPTRVASIALLCSATASHSGL
jgi:hypothetical protein